MSVDPDIALANAEATIANYESQCHRCRAGFPSECVADFDPETLCSHAGVSPADYVTAVTVRDALTKAHAKGRRPPATKGAAAVPEPERPSVDSGYIHPDAFPYAKDIGDFTDPESTGRKAVKRMYPLEGTGMICEWAGKRVHGLPGGPILGCTGNPATDWHHGPDKNTLNNEKGSWGVGVQENVHLICSECHNLAHATIDKHYPPYDRKLQQDRPWLPQPFEGIEWGAITLEHLTEQADIDALIEQERKRLLAQARSGKATRGRGSTGQGHAESVLVDDEEQEHEE